ncbi:MAG: TIGR03546 family protein [Chromatiales bacterium]|nr:TIGR03546 family protein [Chromatiales bacterium]
MLNQLLKLIKALNAETDPWQLSLAFVLAMIMGFTPLISLHNLLILLLALVIRVNLSGFILAFGFFTGIAYLLDPLFIRVGESLLLKPELRDLWTGLYQSDFWLLTHFNHNITLGSVVVSLSLALPLFFLFNWIIVNYRHHILAWVRSSHVVQVIKATKVFRLYETFSKVREAV